MLLRGTACGRIQGSAGATGPGSSGASRSPARGPGGPPRLALAWAGRPPPHEETIVSQRRTDPADADLLVLGAGPAGLAAAWRAAREGHRVRVLEREDRVGGAAGSLEVAGVRVDHGSHRLHRATDPEILAALRDLLGSDLQRRRRHGRIRLAGRWLGFPLRVPDLVRSLPPGFALRTARDALRTAFVDQDRTSFDSAVRTGLGDTMADRFYGPYATKLWGLDPTEIDVRQADVRISADSPLRILRRLIEGADSDQGAFFYPRRGFGQLAESLARAAREAGATIALSTPATEIELDGDAITVGTPEGRLRAPRVFSTVPLPVLAHLAEAPPEVREAAGRLESRAMVLVYLVLAVPRHTRFDAHYLPETWTPVTRISEPKNYRDGHPTDTDPGDPTDRTVLCAELPCGRGDGWWRAEPDRLRRVVVEALERAELPVPPVREVQVERLPAAYPVYRRGFGRDLDVLDRWATAQPGLLTFGRQGLFVHDNTHHTLSMAWAATAALGPDGGFDDTAWERARRRFESHVVED